jgi:hypothetical protein
VKRLAITLVAVLGAALLPATPAGACGGPLATLDTFYVATEWSTKKLRPGSTVTVEVTVTRPNDEDPARQGIPTPRPTSEPVEGATVGTTIYYRNGYTWGSGLSGADGKAKYEFAIAKNAKPGPADAPSAAILIHNASGPDCTQIEELGYTYDALKVVRP